MWGDRPAAEQGEPKKKQPEAPAAAAAGPDRTTETFGDWSIVCAASGGAGERSCEVDTSIVLRDQSAPFARFAASWSGGGSIDLQNGTSERLRCRASYAVGAGGSTLQQQLRCASDSYRFEVSSSVESRAGTLSGSWSEATRNVNGKISGRAAVGRIQAHVDAGVFAADLTVNTSGNQQSVAIVPQGADIRIVAVTMRRG